MVAELPGSEIVPHSDVSQVHAIAQAPARGAFPLSAPDHGQAIAELPAGDIYISASKHGKPEVVELAVDEPMKGNHQHTTKIVYQPAKEGTFELDSATTHHSSTVVSPDRPMMRRSSAEESKTTSQSILDADTSLPIPPPVPPKIISSFVPSQPLVSPMVPHQIAPIIRPTSAPGLRQYMPYVPPPSRNASLVIPGYHAPSSSTLSPTHTTMSPIHLPPPPPHPPPPLRIPTGSMNNAISLPNASSNIPELSTAPPTTADIQTSASYNSLLHSQSPPPLPPRTTPSPFLSPTIGESRRRYSTASAPSAPLKPMYSPPIAMSHGAPLIPTSSARPVHHTPAKSTSIIERPTQYVEGMRFTPLPLPKPCSCYITNCSLQFILCKQPHM